MIEKTVIIENTLRVLGVWCILLIYKYILWKDEEKEEIKEIGGEI